jgi:hypothetical protein
MCRCPSAEGGTAAKVSIKLVLEVELVGELTTQLDARLGKALHALDDALCLTVASVVKKAFPRSADGGQCELTRILDLQGLPPVSAIQERPGKEPPFRP